VSAEDRLRRELASFPQPWRPQPGDVLVGSVLDVGERESKFGGSYPTVTVETAAGELVIVHAYHTVIRDELAQLQPATGERIGFAYHGRGPEGYHRYRVKVERRSAA
jgi:hypothetical protein